MRNRLRALTKWLSTIRYANHRAERIDQMVKTIEAQTKEINDFRQRLDYQNAEIERIAGLYESVLVRLPASPPLDQRG